MLGNACLGKRTRFMARQRLCGAKSRKNIFSLVFHLVIVCIDDFALPKLGSKEVGARRLDPRSPS